MAKSVDQLEKELKKAKKALKKAQKTHTQQQQQQQQVEPDYQSMNNESLIKQVLIMLLSVIGPLLAIFLQGAIQRGQHGGYGAPMQRVTWVRGHYRRVGNPYWY